MKEPAQSSPAPEAKRAECFVVMPFGRSPKEIKWFRGWYELVIEPAVKDSGFSPVLAAAQEQPDAINDEIRYHLAFDPMVVVDLGGSHADEAPNPNVMYELGIRHAFGLPVVLLAWEAQQLPFDINNQRAIMCGREMLDIAPTRAKIVSFIKAAQAGHFYNPMEAVGRRAQLNNATKALGEESVLKNLVDEIEDLKRNVRPKPRFRPQVVGNRARDYLTKKTRKRIKEALIAQAMPAQLWEPLLGSELPFDLGAEAANWDVETWTSYLWMKAQEAHRSSNEIAATGVSESFSAKDDRSTLEKVAKLLPPQPWPKHVHKMVATALGITNAKASRAINELVCNGTFLPQIAGRVFEPRSSDEAAAG